ncbi:hypothetical protein [Mesorhizobium sp.]|uniref:hypothetical protein n=1 Tax=Mesorhizobium sp. TaxID=1871066 RepID=UPI00257E1D50|nr:hypothetical protein [Mesorhizobium sp.]
MSTAISPTPLDQPIVAWLAHQRALGRRYYPEERVLVSLREFISRPDRILTEQALIGGVPHSLIWQAIPCVIANALSACSAFIDGARSRAALSLIPCTSRGPSLTGVPLSWSLGK